MVNAFIFHGTGGHPGENWFPWLKGELEARGCRTVIPQFPTPKDQTLENWFSVFDKHASEFGPDSLMVAHSLGCAFLLRVLEKYDVQARAAFFVSAPVGVRPIKNWEGDQPFIGKPFDWARIRAHARRFVVFHSDNDPYVSLGNGQKLARELGVKLSFISGCGHFNASAGFTRFDALLNAIRPDLPEL